MKNSPVNESYVRGRGTCGKPRKMSRREVANFEKEVIQRRRELGVPEHEVRRGLTGLS